MKFGYIGIIVKSIIFYLMFIIIIALISEWLSSLNCNISNSNTVTENIDTKLDSFLSSMKDELKNEIKKAWNVKNLTSVKKENFLNYYPNDTFPPSVEQSIIEEATKRIAASNPYFNTSQPVNLLGQSHLKTVNHPSESQNFITRATTDDYKVTDKQINLDALTDSKILSPINKNYQIDDIIFTPGTYKPKKFNISGLDNYSTSNEYSYI